MTKSYLVLDECVERPEMFYRTRDETERKGWGGEEGLGYILRYSANMGKRKDLAGVSAGR